MRIFTPYNYDKIMEDTKLVFLSSDEATNYTPDLPEYTTYSLSTRQKDDLLIATITRESFTLYEYRSLYLTDTDLNVLAVVVLDSLQKITSKTLSFRIKIDYHQYDPGEYQGVLSLTGMYCEENPYTAPETSTLINNHTKAVEKNQEQPVWRNLVVKGDQFFNSVFGLAFDQSINVILPNIVEGIPTVELWVGQSIYKLDLLNKICYTDANSVPEEFVKSELPANCIGFLNLTNMQDFLTGNHIAFLPEGVSFRCLRRDRDVVFIRNNQLEFLGVTFDDASEYLGADVTGSHIQRFLSDTHAVFRNPYNNRVIVSRISDGFISRFISREFCLYPMNGNLVIFVHRICDSDWNYTTPAIQDAFIEVNGKSFITRDFIPINFFNQQYLLVDHRLRLSNII